MIARLFTMVAYRAVLIPLPFVVHINDVESTVAGIILEFEDVRNGLQHLLYNIQVSSGIYLDEMRGIFFRSVIKERIYNIRSDTEKCKEAVVIAGICTLLKW